MSLSPALPGHPEVAVRSGVRPVASKGTLISVIEQAWDLKGRLFPFLFQTCVYVCVCVCVCVCV